MWAAWGGMPRGVDAVDEADVGSDAEGFLRLEKKDPIEGGVLLPVTVEQL